METKGITCKIPLDLHNRISEEIPAEGDDSDENCPDEDDEDVMPESWEQDDDEEEETEPADESPEDEETEE